MDIRDYNRRAWDRQVEGGNRWTIPVTPEVIAAAQKGVWEVLLTPTRAVPREWFPAGMAGVDLLCLASGGGQQGPVFSAAGANVTVLDNSPKQLAQDRYVTEREGLRLNTIEGDMADLSVFADQSFDLIFHPVSNLFVSEIRPVWREAHRVLRHGGALLAGIMNPAFYIFDLPLLEKGRLEVRYSLPYSDLGSLSEVDRQQYLESGYPLEFGHTLEDQIGGQIDAGFVIAGFYEDTDPETYLSKFMPIFIATRAQKS
ncbi:MAG TPA: class I SAM-dependent methyltransferase [Anaerolineales bacterium]|nr:class I SAM-dependent methyltransferase [Anaerolineales bacterium]